MILYDYSCSSQVIPSSVGSRFYYMITDATFHIFALHGKT